MCVCKLLRSYHVIPDDLSVVRVFGAGRLVIVGHVRVGEIEDARGGLIVWAGVRLNSEKPDQSTRSGL